MLIIRTSNLTKSVSHYAISVLLSLVIILLFAGCEHRDLCYDHPHTRIPVNVEFDWTNDPTASPAGMTVYFFPNEVITAPYYAFDFKGNTGGIVNLPPGTYSALCFNNDSDKHGLVRTSSHNEFGLWLTDLPAYGNIGSPLNRIRTSDNERFAHCPDPMWIGSVSTITIEIPPQNIDDRKETHIVRFEMQPAVHEYTFIIHNPKNYSKSISLTGTVTGMSGTLHPGRGMTGAETVTHTFEIQQSTDGSLIGVMLTFGHCANNPVGTRSDEDIRDHILTVYATLSNGKIWSTSYNITQQLHTSQDPDCVVEIDTIELPEAPKEGGGFHPTVNGWEGNSETIGM